MMNLYFCRYLRCEAGSCSPRQGDDETDEFWRTIKVRPVDDPLFKTSVLETNPLRVRMRADEDLSKYVKSGHVQSLAEVVCTIMLTVFNIIHFGY